MLCAGMFVAVFNLFGVKKKPFIDSTDESTIVILNYKILWRMVPKFDRIPNYYGGH